MGLSRTYFAYVAVLSFLLCSFVFVGYLFFSLCVCVLLRWPARWTFVFSDNLPQCCVLIELLYCGLIKFFFFFVPFPRQTAISVENRKIFRPRVFCAPAEGVLLGIGYLRSEFKKTRMKGLLGGERNLTISSSVWIQCTNVTDGWTDGHRAVAKTALTHSVVR